MRLMTGVLVVLILLSLSSYSRAEDIEGMLNRAKAEGKIVMLQAGSEGCIPCEQMKPVMQKLRDTYREKLEVIFIDVSEDHEIGRRMGVRVIPTQVFLDKSGKEFHRHIGFYSFEKIVPVLKKAGI